MWTRMRRIGRPRLPQEMRRSTGAPRGSTETFALRSASCRGIVSLAQVAEIYFRAGDLCSGIGTGNEIRRRGAKSDESAIDTDRYLLVRREPGEFPFTSRSTAVWGVHRRPSTCHAQKCFRMRRWEPDWLPGSKTQRNGRPRLSRAPSFRRLPDRRMRSRKPVQVKIARQGMPCEQSRREQGNCECQLPDTPPPGDGFET